MKVLLTTEFNEMVSPLMLLQVKKAIATTLELYGLKPSITDDRSASWDGERRYWEWVEKQRDGG